MRDLDPADVRLARTWVEFYQRRGYQCLPSDPRPEAEGGGKRPLIRYADLWEETAPADLFDRHPTTNLQVMTGRHWGLLVIDLDGQEAIDHWKDSYCSFLHTWITHSGGNGWHVWYSIPHDLPSLPKATLWRKDPSRPRVKGEPAIERLCDRSLVMAPPSIHPRTGNRYTFFRHHTPKEYARPAPCPSWLIQLKPIDTPIVARVPVALAAPQTPLVEPTGVDLRTADVLDAIHDKLGLAQSWGLRIAGRSANHRGWVSCHAVGREDRNPSAAFSPETGGYWEPDLGRVSLFDLAVLLGAYPDWVSAREDVARRHGLISDSA